MLFSGIYVTRTTYGANYTIDYSKVAWQNEVLKITSLLLMCAHELAVIIDTP